MTYLKRYFRQLWSLEVISMSFSPKKHILSLQCSSQMSPLSGFHEPTTKTILLLFHTYLSMYSLFISRHLQGLSIFVFPRFSRVSYTQYTWDKCVWIELVGQWNQHEWHQQQWKGSGRYQRDCEGKPLKTWGKNHKRKEKSSKDDFTLLEILLLIEFQKTYR